MSIRIVLGRAGYGKSRYCIEEIKNNINSNNTLIYIVPEQYSLGAEFGLTDALSIGGTINVQVLTFKRLAYRIFSELGFTKTTFSKASKSMLIYYIMLKQGKIADETIYSKDPVFMAKLWKAKGAERLHVVDLDGSFSGNQSNNQIIGNICLSVDIPVDVGGGIRNMKRNNKKLA